MKRQLFFLLIAILACTKLQAQCPDSITFSTQAQIDNFLTDYPGCTIIPGNVTIRGNGISNLLGLFGLTSIGSNLTIDSNLVLQNLTGLNSLTDIGGDLIIKRNYALLGLNGLNNLSTVGGNLHIGHASDPFTTPGNDLLTNLNGLENLDSIAGDLFIHDNAALVNLNGIENVAYIGGQLKVNWNTSLLALANLEHLHTLGSMEIFSNANLGSLTGLDSIHSISGGVLIWGTSQLTNLAGLNSLDSIGGNLTLMANNNLVNLSGLNHLHFIGGNLDIVAFLGINPNTELTSLNGLDSLHFIGGNLNISDNPVLSDITALGHHIIIGGDLKVEDNPLLSVCAVQSICDYLDNPSGAVSIYTNAPGCNFQTEVLAVCKGFSNVIQGTLYWEDQPTCLYDSTEQTLKQWLVKAESGSQTFYAVTDTAGYFSMLVDTGTYALSAVLPNDLWVSCDTINLNFSQLLQTTDTAVGVQAAIACPYLNVDIATNRLRPCLDNFYNVSWCNEGTAVAESTYVVLVFDPDLVVDTSTLPDPWTDLGSNSFRIELGDVAPGECGAFSARVTVPCDAVLGARKCVEAYIFPDTICFPTPGWDGSNIVVEAECVGDSVQFRVINTGNDMLSAAKFIIIENVVLRTGSFQLPEGGDTIITVPSNSAFLRMEAEQPPGHPFSETASADSDGCPDSALPSLSFQYPQDEGSPFVARDCRPVVASWDPNDKQAAPQGLGNEHIIRDNTPFKYLIRFQNTGTVTAFRVVVRDTLSPFLDIASVKPGASSHPYRFEITADNVLKFTFENIMLPDSNTNEAASHGFVQFSVRQKSSSVNPPGTRIDNQAAIYFDYNAPVFTNMVFHTVAEPILDTFCAPPDTAWFSYHLVIWVPDDSCATSSLLPDYVSGFRLYPNPTSGDLTLRFTPPVPEKITAVEIRDATGRLKQAFYLSFAKDDSSLTLPARELPDGVYFLTVSSPGKKWAGRFVKLK